MESVLLIMVLLIIGVVGFAFMNKAASFLQGYQGQRRNNIQQDEIRIAFEIPYMADSVIKEMDVLSQRDYKVSFTLLTGNLKDITSMFCEEKVDFLLVSEEPDNIWRQHGKKEIPLYPEAVVTSVGELKIMPADKAAKHMFILWGNERITAAQKDFIRIVSS